MSDDYHITMGFKQYRTFWTQLNKILDISNLSNTQCYFILAESLPDNEDMINCIDDDGYLQNTSQMKLLPRDLLDPTSNSFTLERNDVGESGFSLSLTCTDIPIGKGKTYMGYYYNHHFYEDILHTKELTIEQDDYFIDKLYPTRNYYNNNKECLLIDGYYEDGMFYKELNDFESIVDPQEYDAQFYRDVRTMTYYNFVGGYEEATETEVINTIGDLMFIDNIGNYLMKGGFLCTKHNNKDFVISYFRYSTSISIKKSISFLEEDSVIFKIGECTQ